jgi:hypothetical protein
MLIAHQTLRLGLDLNKELLRDLLVQQAVAIFAETA